TGRRPDPDGAQVTRFSTERGGKPPASVDSGALQADESGISAVGPGAGSGQPVDDDGAPETADLAHSALADARRIARGRPRRGGDSDRNREIARRTRRANMAGRN